MVLKGFGPCHYICPCMSTSIISLYCHICLFNKIKLTYINCWCTWQPMNLNNYCYKYYKYCLTDEGSKLSKSFWKQRIIFEQNHNSSILQCSNLANMYTVFLPLNAPVFILITTFLTKCLFKEDVYLSSNFLTVNWYITNTDSWIVKCDNMLENANM